MTSGAPSRPRTREEGKRETRRALVRAGLEEIIEHGFDAPSLDSICARAGYTRGAFYVHFENREQFLGAVMTEVADGFLDVVLTDEDEEIGLDEIVNRFLEAVRRGETPLRKMGLRIPQLFEGATRMAVARENIARIYRQAIERVLRIAELDQRLAAARTDLEASQLATVLVALALGVLALTDAGVDLDLDELGEATLQLIRR